MFKMSRDFSSKKILLENYRHALKNGSNLDEALLASEKQLNLTSKPKTSWRDHLPFVSSLIIGIIFIIIALAPTLAFTWQNKISHLVFASENKIIAPIPQSEIVSSETPPAFTPSQIPTMTNNNQLDYSNLSNWFVVGDNVSSGKLPSLPITTANETNITNSPEPTYDDNQLKPYQLHISSLNIHRAQVGIGGLDLNQHLIHYESTPKPGNPGTAVIFGHSTLRQWYAPQETNPERYKSIFSTIMTLEIGDEIILTLDDQNYIYEVIDKKNVKPENTNAILAQDLGNSYLRLVTCTPEGTTLMRGLIEAVLIDIQPIN